MKVLILKPSSLGDVVHALPVVRLLKLQYPQAEVHWWINRGLMPLLEADRDIDVLYPFDRKGWSRPDPWLNFFTGLKAMRQSRFDWVIDLQGLLRSSLVAWLADGAFTIGVDDHREGARAFYDAVLTRPKQNLHAVDFNLSICGALGIPTDREFEWLPCRPLVAEAVKTRFSRGQGPLIALQPGARWETKRWPVNHFIELVRRLSDELGNVQFIVLGGADEQEFTRAIQRAEPALCLDLAGKTTIPELVEWIRLCDLLVSNDTGPMHLAAAMDVPTLALFGPTSPAQTGPYGQMDRVVLPRVDCAPCFKDDCRNPERKACLNGITPQEVASRSIQLLGQARNKWKFNSGATRLRAK